MLLAKSIKQLGASSGADRLSFWGKVQGTERDYYIVEAKGVAGEGDEEEAPADKEARGTEEGVNEFAYFVTNNPATGEWTALPDLLPSDIQAARCTKVHFSGDLERRIITNPFFEKQEKHYLRAQIARITHSTKLIPAGLKRLGEEDPEVIEDNTPEEGDIVLPTAEKMSSKGNWVHLSKSLLQKAGRTNHLQPEEGDEEEDPEVALKRVKDADPAEPRLKPITSDKTVQGGFPAWTLRVHGDRTNYKSANPAFADQNNSVVVVKSLFWPGAFNFYVNKQFFSIYVGDGHKYEEATFYPINPPSICEDPVEKAVHAEVSFNHL